MKARKILAMRVISGDRMGMARARRRRTVQEKGPSQMEGVKLLLTSATGLAVLIYAVGYCCHLGHHKMLGISQIEYAHETVIFDGVAFFILTPACVFLAFCTSWLVWVISLLSGAVFLLQRRARSAVRAESRTWRDRISPLGTVNVAGVILLHMLFLVLAKVVCSQVDMLLVGRNRSVEPGLAEVLHRTLTPYSPQLTKLLETGVSWAVYGQLFMTAIICIVWWVGRILRSCCGNRSSKEISGWKRTWRHVFMVSGLYVVVLLVVLVFYSYGFLVKSNKYAVIELQTKKTDGPPAGTYFALGDCGSRTLLYSPDEDKGRLWWVDKTTYLPASRSEARQDLFDKDRKR